MAQPKKQYQTLNVTSGVFASLDDEIARVATREGKAGWRLDSVTKESKGQARVQFTREA
ncbi:hypothetical protein Srot_0901 [Segniliparus rotundus DSM 44985]|uniref:DUF4177 domain-containing protein n=1 Tax=Segniliparus rotundus (strain ATCC BAA-972 / CDC 1076 / CIP 108378 / DSM 44985 / JCM 13578) TaxID=640132 RepID=D6ZE98_SEGRD|nr:hypothetical protein [Segniliparus rotundus]ADG97378.1 hypothetical protein Srot_0901 [Segniliparus rotundus DSM 44985]